MRQSSVFRFGDFVLDASQRRLLRSGEDVDLPPKTFDLLLHLLQHRDRVLTKDELLEAVWRDVNVVENTLAQRIREIREALRAGASASTHIVARPHRRGRSAHACAVQRRGNSAVTTRPSREPHRCEERRIRARSTRVDRVARC